MFFKKIHLKIKYNTIVIRIMYNVYYKDVTTGSYLVCNSKTLKCKRLNRIPYDKHNFQLHAKRYKLTNKYNYDDTNKNTEEFMAQCINPELKEYCKNLQTWTTEIENSKMRTSKFQYMLNNKICNHNINIRRFMASTFSKKANDIIKSFPPITFTESQCIESTFNAGLAKFHGIKNQNYNVLTYDFKMSYLTLMASKLKMFGENQDFNFPSCEGEIQDIELKFLKKVNRYKYLKVGIYHFKIITDNVDFLKWFQFNHLNHYTELEMNFLFDIADDYNIVFENLQEHMIFNETVNGYNIFNEFYNRSKELKQEFPKNALVKQLSSASWGYLSESNCKFYTEEELDDKPEIVTTVSRNEIEDEHTHYIVDVVNKINLNQTVYKIQDLKKPYVTNFRIKPWITAFQRIQLYSIIIHIGFNKVLRYHTDSVSFNKDLLNDDDIEKLNAISNTFIYEDKTSGNMFYNNGRFN